jgi:hypothetical protein
LAAIISPIKKPAETGHREKASAFAPKRQSSKTVHSFVADLVSGPASATSPTMIKEISQRIYSVAVVSLWVAVVAGTSAVILASTVNGGISW